MSNPTNEDLLKALQPFIKPDGTVDTEAIFQAIEKEFGPEMVEQVKQELMERLKPDGLWHEPIPAAGHDAMRRWRKEKRKIG